MNTSNKKEYKGSECNTCGYQGKISLENNFTVFLLLHYVINLKASYPDQNSAKDLKLPRGNCPNCNKLESFFSPWLEKKVVELDAQSSENLIPGNS